MKKLELRVRSLRACQRNNIRKSKWLCNSMQMRLEIVLPFGFGLHRIPTEGFAYSDRYVYVGELESSNPRARYDLPFPHFIDPPCYTNKLVAPPPCPLTPKESYSDAIGRSSLLPFVVSEIDDIPRREAVRSLEVYFREAKCKQACVK